jgi:PAS domain S-box-containing protein
MNPEFERPIGQRSHELEDANEVLRRSEEINAKEMQTLHLVATQLISASGMEALYDQILDTALGILHADLATLQMVYPARGTLGELKLLGHRGFSPETVKRWEWVSPDSRTTCGEALRTGRTVVVSDVRKCDFMAGSEDLQAFLDAGIHAAQSLPLVSRSGALLGMVTTYWRHPYELSVEELRALDILARLAADLIERSRAEEALWENQQRLASIYDTVRDSIFHLAVEPDGQFRFVSVNAAFLRVTGLNREAVVGKTVNQVVPEASLAMVLGEYQRAIEKRTTVLWEETSDYPAGRLTGEVGVTPVFDKTGRCTHLVGSVHDITERKQAESALRESEERLRHMADAAPVMIWVTGPDKLCTFVNKPWLDFRGRTLEQEQGNGWVEGIHPEDIDRCLSNYNSAFDSRRPFHNECRFRRADGVYRWVLDNGMPVYRAGAFAGFIGTCVDITEQKLIEQRLRASEVRLMGAQRLAKLGSWERDDATESMELSDEMLRILGMPDRPPQSLGEFLDYVHPEDRKRVLETAQQVRLTGAPGGGEYRIVRANGEVRFVRSILETIRNEHGTVIRVVGVTQDITDLKLAQQESFARQKLESLGTLASGIAHDFNNLLGGVLAQAELALAELADGLHPEKELQAIRDVAMRGSEIVRQLMVYAGKESAVVGTVDLSRLVQDTIELLKVSVSKQARLETDLSNDLPAVQADAAQLRQILMNLVTNASESIGDRDGVIRVTTRYARENQDPSGAVSGHQAETDYVQLEVSDTGYGMTPEMQSKVFDPFFTTKIAGHGLGLAIVDGLVRSLHGKIHLASEPGKGTTFRILLPSSGRPAIPELVSPEEVENFSGWATVLVVEDEEMLRQSIAKMLRRTGFQVLEASNGSAAIDLLRENGSKIDVVLLDMTIPGPSSSEVAAEYVRARSDAKIILTSAYSEEVARATITGPQGGGFIRKPFHLTDLVKTLRNIVSS